MKLVRTVALLVAHVASSTTRVHADRPDNWKQCADYPPNPTKDPIKITVTLDQNGTADWATGNEAYWQNAKASIQELLQDDTFNQVMVVCRNSASGTPLKILLKWPTTTVPERSMEMNTSKLLNF